MGVLMRGQTPTRSGSIHGGNVNWTSVHDGSQKDGIANHGVLILVVVSDESDGFSAPNLSLLLLLYEHE
jgi:hypothetical protein